MQKYILLYRNFHYDIMYHIPAWYTLGSSATFHLNILLILLHFFLSYLFGLPVILQMLMHCSVFRLKSGVRPQLTALSPVLQYLTLTWGSTKRYLPKYLIKPYLLLNVNQRGHTLLMLTLVKCNKQCNGVL